MEGRDWQRASAVSLLIRRALTDLERKERGFARAFAWGQRGAPSLALARVFVVFCKLPGQRGGVREVGCGEKH
jgi:hypothetical protein